MDDFLQVILEETEKVFKPIISNQVPFLMDIEKDENENSEIIDENSSQNNPLLGVSHQCKHCNDKFSTKSDYNIHLQKSHRVERPFRCLYCDKTFSTKNILKQHERIHTKERPYICQYCRKNFSHRTALANHIRTHTGEKPFDCNYCEKSFGEKAKLLLHMRVHTGEKPFVCHHCQRAFRDKSSFNVHLRIHTGEKPFRCNYCQRCFTHRNSFKDHLRIHTGERPFVCLHCRRDFAKQSTLRKHLEVHGVVKPFELHVHAIIKKNEDKDDNSTVEKNVNSEEKIVDDETNSPERISPSTALCIMKKMLGFKKKLKKNVTIEIGNNCDTDVVVDVSKKLLTNLYKNQVHVCTFCHSSHDSNVELENHLSDHPDQSKTWKFGIDLIYLITEILGLDVTHALGFNTKTPSEVLEEFLDVAGISNNKISNKNEVNISLMQSNLRSLFTVVVPKKDRDIVSLESVCILNLLYDMITIYPLLDEGT